MEELEQLTIFDTSIDMDVMSSEEALAINELVEEVVIPEDNIAESEEILEETPYIEQEIVPYEIGDSVRVDPDSLDGNDVLNYNYLIDFLKKKGIVTKVIHKPTLQYEVTYGDTIACMYHKDLTI